MSLERLLQLSMATLATLATVMLGLGERSPLLPLLAAIAAFSSVYFTDQRGWIRLNHFGYSLIAGAVAAAAAIWDYQRFDRENQLLALANLLVYLQCSLCFWEKNPRIYWMLAVLSLLQVAVATVLNSSLWFGMLLVLYLFVALTAVSSLLIYREKWRFDESAEHLTRTLLPAANSARRWPLVGEPAGFAPRLASLSPRSFAVASHARQVLRMGLGSLLCCSVAFALVPRTQKSNWGEAVDATEHTVGFNDGITLGEMGEIVDDPEEVIEMQFVHPVTNLPYELSEAPLLRGATLMDYSRGQWKPSHSTLGAEQIIHWSETQFKLSDLVRQDFVVDPLDTSTLFAVFPVYYEHVPPRDGKDILYDGIHDKLRRRHNRRRSKMEYSLLTSGFRNGKQLEIFPCRGRPGKPVEEPTPLPPNTVFRRPFQGDPLGGGGGQPPRYFNDIRPPEGITKQDELFHLLQLTWNSPDSLPQVRELAQQIVQDIPETETIRRARALEFYLRDSGNFRYTVLPPPRDGNLDPVVDFLFHNPQGHCEYFATALTLLCRGVGIPARMVVGFKGADWNPLRQTWHVRQMLAHAWTEIYLKPEELPLSTFAPWQEIGPGDKLPSDWKEGGWLTLDPTPGAGGDDFVPAGDRFPALRHVLDYAEFLWSSYVLSMDAKRQEETIFNPLQQGTTDMRALLFDKDSWRRLGRNLLKILRGERPDDLGLWFSWPAALLTMFVLVVCLILYRLTRWIVRRWLRATRASQAQASSAAHVQVEFYRRLESLLASHSLVRSEAQTQREFALHVGDQLALDPRTLPVALLPRRIVEAFYRVRFGGSPLDNRELEAVEQSLQKLAEALP